MKTAIYIENGVNQIVLTPENEFELNILTSLENQELKPSICMGEFYDCQGGWTRHRPVHHGTYGVHSKERSLIIRYEKVNTNDQTDPEV